MRAAVRARELGCSAMQVFLKGTVNWSARSIGRDEALAFRQAAADAGVVRVLAHGAYLTNLAEPLAAPRKRAIDGFLIELERAAALGVESVILHPGSHRGAGARAGVETRPRCSRRAPRPEPGAPGARLARERGRHGDLARRLDCGARRAGERRRVARRLRARVAARRMHRHVSRVRGGSRIPYRRGPRGVLARGRRGIGIARVGAIHVNDSKCPLGSRRDRHESIGRGHLGRAAFRHLLQTRASRRFRKSSKRPRRATMDRRNLALLRRLARPPRKPADPLRHARDLDVSAMRLERPFQRTGGKGRIVGKMQQGMRTAAHRRR